MRRGLMVWMTLVGAVALAGCYKVATFWSPDGKSIAYLAEGGLRLYDAATRESKPLDTGEGRVISAAWSADGQRIAFYAATLGEEGEVSLRVLEPATGKVSTLALDVWPLPKGPVPAEPGESDEQALREAQEEELDTFEYLAWPAWSPDGRCVAYVGASEQITGVFLLTYPDEAIHPVPRDAQMGMQIAPAWSPDGKRLAYMLIESMPAEPPPGGDTQALVPDSVWLYDAAAGESVKVCDVPGEALAAETPLQWSRDGREIGFIALGADQEAGIGCVVEARGGASARQAVTGLPGRAAWSPGLDAVAYVGEAGETGEVPVLYRSVGAEGPRVLGTLDLTAEGEPDLLSGLGDVGAPPCSLPQFSPDGSRVALLLGREPDEIKVVVFEVK